MIKKFIVTSLIFMFYSIHAFSAGSGGDGVSSKTKTNYEKAVSYVKFAKKYEIKKIIKKHKNY